MMGIYPNKTLFISWALAKVPLRPKAILPGRCYLFMLSNSRAKIGIPANRLSHRVYYGLKPQHEWENSFHEMKLGAIKNS